MIPWWSESSTCLQTGFDFLDWIRFLVCFFCCLESFPQSLDFDTAKLCSTPAAFFFSFFSLGSPELNGSCTVYLMPYYSCYHFAPKMFSSYSITLSLRFNVMLTCYSLLCLVNFNILMCCTNSKRIWCLETVVLCGKNGWFVNLSL